MEDKKTNGSLRSKDSVTKIITFKIRCTAYGLNLLWFSSFN